MMRRIVLIFINLGLLIYLLAPSSPGGVPRYQAVEMPEEHVEQGMAHLTFEDAIAKREPPLFSQPSPVVHPIPVTTAVAERIQLLGIISTTAGAVALVMRESDGTVARIAAGERLGDAVVKAVTERSVTLYQHSEEVELHLDGPSSGRQ